MNRKISLLFFLVGVVGGGLLIGIFTAPGEWYASLTKPSFNPPGWLFAPVWTVLYVLIAIAGWRIHQRGAQGLLNLWFLQMALNFLWSPVFFGAQMMTVALAIIVLLLGTILLFIWRAWPVDRMAALLFAPYAAWVAFATLLNASLVALNT